MAAIPLKVLDSQKDIIQRLNLRVKSTGRIEPSSDNAYRILCGYPDFSAIRYNTLDHNIYDGAKVMEDPQIVGVLMKIQREIDAGFRRASVDDALSHLSINPARVWNPLTDWLSSLKWDGEPRMEMLFLNYFNCAMGPHRLTMPEVYLRQVASNWLTMLMARAFQPGCKADYMLILEGAQGIGKSRAMRVLGGEYYRESKVHDVGNKDFLTALRGSWIFDINELRGFRRSDQETIKALLSSQEDVYRPHYGRTNRTYKRTCVIVGTTNQWEYLSDTTGGRRYWPVRCGPIIEVALLEHDREQIFAEAVERFKSGATWWEMDQDIFREVAAARTMISPHYNVLQELVKLPRCLPRLRVEVGGDGLNAEIWCYITVEMGFDALGLIRRTPRMMGEMGSVLREFGFEQYRAWGRQIGKTEDGTRYTVFRKLLGMDTEFGMTPDPYPGAKE